jgi:hypothetical protein
MKPHHLFVLVTLFFIPLVCQSAHASNGFEARFAGQQTVEGENAIAITFSRGLDTRQNLELYLRIFKETDLPVEGGWVLSKDPQVVYFTNVEPGTQYKVQIYKGLKADSGDILETGVTFRVSTREVAPTISFGSKGFVLTSKLTRGLPVNSLNIPRADIDFFRIKPKFLGEFRDNFAGEDQMHYYQSRNLNKSADLVYSGRWDLEIKRDLRTQVNIPITHIKELAKPGIYFAVLKGAGVYEYGYSSTWFTISDLGLHVRKYAQSLQFQVQSLGTAKSIKDVQVEGVNKKGKILFSLTTNAKGIARVAGAFEDLTLVTATRKNHISLLPMDVPAMDLSEFKRATAPFRPVDLFVYGPRDIYRPGEVLTIDGLLRNQDGQMTAGLPIRAKIFQPDGRMVHEFTWKAQNLNHYCYAYHLPTDALTGKWRIAFTHAAGDLKEYPFIVAEFLPERMKLAIENPAGQENVLRKNQDLVIKLKGDFLYGAPAFGSRADAMIHVKPARELFKEDWPGYEFGDTKNLVNRSFSTDQIILDEKGEGVIQVETQWKEIGSPHWITANASLYDSGGRPVVRNRSWQVWPDKTLVGIRSLAQEGTIKNDSLAQFEVICVDTVGKRLAAKGLKVTVIKEQREYYWEFKHGAWQWGYSQQFYPVDQFSLDLGENKSGVVDVPVKWGGYRLEIANPATGLTTGYKIWAGWRRDSAQGKDMNRPDRVDLVLDKKSYGPGDRVAVTVKAPEGGTGFLFVESDTNLLTLPVTIPPGGKTLEIVINPEWKRHDLYLSALIVRPGESQGRLPKRSVGLVHLPLDREHRRLMVEIQVPKKIEPNRRVTIPVRLQRSDGTVPDQAWVTLAAVDVGILNLTGFKTPSPFNYFFQARQYGVQIHDLYQRLIETNEGTYAKQRFGGDAPTLTRGGDRPATDVQIVALHQQAIKVDARGRADFFLDIPDFNGTLRLMAIAHTDNEFGSGDQELTVASPLVTQMTMPRFLAMGDTSQVALDVHNLTKTRQQLKIFLDATSPLTPVGDKIHEVTLEPNGKSVILMPLSAEQKLGRSTITCRVQGLVVEGEDREMERRWFLETRPAFPVKNRAWQKRIPPGQSFKIEAGQMADLLSSTIGIQAGMGSSPPINVADHVALLDAYPYGCLEQTVSGLFPHVLLSGDDFAQLGIGTGTDRDKDKNTAEKIRLGIQRLVEKQKTNGGFGLWDSKGPEAAWLTAYAVHFLLNAADAGYEISQTVVKRAMERLLVYVRRPASIPLAGYLQKDPYRAAVRAYAAFVLVRVQALGLGDARVVYQYVLKHGKGALAFVQAGVALSAAGDRIMAMEAFDQAIKTRRDPHLYYGDYGSDIRDFAAAYYYLSTYFPMYEHSALFLVELNTLLADKQWLSTQERNALVMAGSIRLYAKGDPWKARVTAGEQTLDLSRDQFKQLVFARGTATGNFEILNTGTTDLFVHVILSGYPVQKSLPASHGVTIKRRYLDISGKVLEKTDFKKIEFKSGDRILVELAFQAEKSMPHCLVVDMLPAGIELEDPALSGSTLINDIRVDDRSISQWQKAYTTQHTEYRDDRFMAALDIRGKQRVRIFYPARVVTPGTFLVPPPLVEDMYRPHIRGVGASPDRMKVMAP